MKTAYADQYPDSFRNLGLEGVLVLDENGKILSANRAAELLLRYGAGQLTDMFLSDIWKEGPPSEQLRRQAAELLCSDGEPLPVAIALSPVNGSTRDGTLAVFADRSDLDRINELLAHAQRLAGIGTMTASAAHELMNPISIITATCANVVDDLNDDVLDRDELRQAIGLIEQSAFRCARIVEVLRNYASTAGHEDIDGPTIAITSPAAILEDALTMVEQQFRKQARVTVETDLQPELATIFCDHHRIAQVLINLLINARDAMQPVGGVIRVRAWIPDLSREPVLAECTHRTAIPAKLFAFSVTDTGTGIDLDTMDHLFEPFFTTKPAGQGSGLGLFIARGIVTQHGGCIHAANNPEGGATFTFALPHRP